MDLAGLYTRRDSGWSGRYARLELWLAAGLGGCGCCGRWEVRGCFTGARTTGPGDRLVPGWLPVWLELGTWCFSCLLRGLIFLGSLRGSSGGGRFSLPWSLEGEGGPCHDLLREGERCQGPNLNTSRREVGSQLLLLLLLFYFVIIIIFVLVMLLLLLLPLLIILFHINVNTF